MERIQGPEAAAGIRDSFDEISPDFGRYIVEAGFADIYGREELTLAQRQLLNVGVLTAIGGVERQLAVHIRGALNVEVTPSEIIEAIFHVALMPESRGRSTGCARPRRSSPNSASRFRVPPRIPAPGSREAEMRAITKLDASALPTRSTPLP